MSNDNHTSLPNYILKSMNGAWKLVQAKPNAMDYFDLSSDGFWKSFWAIAAMLPGLILITVFHYQNNADLANVDVAATYPYLSNTVFFFLALPFTAFVMAYFTKFMKIDQHYASMIIAYNWMSAIVFLIMAIATVILGSGVVGSAISGIILIILGTYFSIYVPWFTFKVGLNISGMLAIGVLIFVKLLDASLIVVLFKVLNPEHFELIFAAANNQPS